MISLEPGLPYLEEIDRLLNSPLPPAWLFVLVATKVFLWISFVMFLETVVRRKGSGLKIGVSTAILAYYTLQVAIQADPGVRFVHANAVFSGAIIINSLLIAFVILSAKFLPDRRVGHGDERPEKPVRDGAAHEDSRAA